MRSNTLQSLTLAPSKKASLDKTFLYHVKPEINTTEGSESDPKGFFLLLVLKDEHVKLGNIS